MPISCEVTQVVSGVEQYIVWCIVFCLLHDYNKWGLS